MSDKICLDLNERFFEKDGKYYINKSVRLTKTGGRLIFEQVDRKEFEGFLKHLAKELVEKSGVSAEMIVLESLRSLPKNALERIQNKLNEETPVVVEHHCLRLKIGKEIVQLAV
jgi:hypothetical protein